MGRQGTGDRKTRNSKPETRSRERKWRESAGRRVKQLLAIRRPPHIPGLQIGASLRPMKLARILPVLLLAAATLGATAAPMGARDARHLLERTGFGARPQEIAEFAGL
ncbi:MAG TPA: hypothetical protein DHV08_07540, partial [Rhodocyclaceae bacterium]|nr:hypothetical protein [Rhodocyclaceae bacterium]